MARLRLSVLAIALFALGGCVNLDRLPAVPTSAQNHHAVNFLDLPEARFIPGADRALVIQSWYATERRRAARQGPGRPYHMLALSGGGGDGAYGAGLLYAWTERGDRPEFELVTGVSTGALIAPLAFLGSRYDEQLKHAYTSISDSDIANPRPILSILSSDSVADTSPLAALIDRTLTDAMIQEIAAEFRKGRLLLISTTDLDLGRPVVWNIGVIAASGRPGAAQIIRRILLASASIPGAFPPVLFDVTVDGQRRQELHVDGGATAQLFLYPSNIPLRTTPPDIRNRRRIAWIVRNGRTSEQQSQTERGLLPIVARSVSTMITANSLGDIYRTYITTKRDGIDFNLAYITDAFAEKPPTPFNRDYMNRLFEHGRETMRAGQSWSKTPPGYAP
ncbi:MAG: patatin-like phospholipase family protein [Alphaproteobacteria bacterium]